MTGQAYPAYNANVQPGFGGLWPPMFTMSTDLDRR